MLDKLKSVLKENKEKRVKEKEHRAREKELEMEAYHKARLGLAVKRGEIKAKQEFKEEIKPNKVKKKSNLGSTFDSFRDYATDFSKNKQNMFGFGETNGREKTKQKKIW